MCYAEEQPKSWLPPVKGLRVCAMLVLGVVEIHGRKSALASTFDLDLTDCFCAGGPCA